MAVITISVITVSLIQHAYTHNDQSVTASELSQRVYPMFYG